jgi:hypothetical protein
LTIWERVLGTLTDAHAKLDKIIDRAEKIMSTLTDLQAADTALKTEVAAFLADVAAALQNAAGDPAAIEQVVADINGQVAALQAGDPVTGTTAAPSGPVTADPGTGGPSAS